ncbi:MAG TPA: AMP-binding protein [Acidimicrobiales bacterium]|jgi:long-chain acyl-CoA synthetase|nr:AMP-binding protein [Acidimicrobiales bacterium]
MDMDVDVLEDRATAAAHGMTVAWWAAQGPDRPALITAFGTRTYGELNANCNRLVRALRARGLVAGDSVALMCTNRPEFLEVLYAAQRAGLRLTPINWHLTAEEAAYIVGNCEAKALIGAAELGDKLTETAKGADGELVCLSVGGVVNGFASYEEVIAEQDGADITDPVFGSQMLYTSGTTGRPKGVKRDGATPSALATVNFCGYDESWQTSVDAHLLTGPLYHAAPLAFSVAVPMLYGVPVVIMEQWDPTETLRLIEEHGITHTHMVPTMFHRMLALNDEVRARYDLSSLRFIIHGAAPCPVTVKSRLIEWLGPIVVEYYAATEGLGTLVDSTTWLAHPGTVGRPMVADLVKVADDDGNPVAPGEVGLVFLRAPAATKFEYFGDAEKTAGAFRGDYFTLGDMGYMDDEGYLFLTDRTANLIISGGVNIYPAEVDAVLLQHPAVGDVATIGIPDEEWGESVLAVVQPAEGVTGDEALAAELIAFCREHLAHFKCPRRIDFSVQLPREDTGKIFKRKLRDDYRERGNAHGNL